METPAQRRVKNRGTGREGAGEAGEVWFTVHVVLAARSSLLAARLLCGGRAAVESSGEARHSRMRLLISGVMISLLIQRRTSSALFILCPYFSMFLASRSRALWCRPSPVPPAQSLVILNGVGAVGCRHSPRGLFGADIVSTNKTSAHVTSHVHDFPSFSGFCQVVPLSKEISQLVRRSGQ